MTERTSHTLIFRQTFDVAFFLNLTDATELDRHEMGEGPRGICLVINNDNFLGEDERQGAKLDEEEIACLFEELHFIW